MDTRMVARTDFTTSTAAIVATMDFAWLAICTMAALIGARFALKWLSTRLNVVAGRNTNRTSPTPRHKQGSPRKSLRGPFNFPVVGYLPFITQMPHRKFQLLSEKYGPIFKINLGNMETVVLNDFQSIWHAFKKEEFLGRPKNIAFNVLINLEGLGTLSGPEWRQQKRFTMQQMRNLGFGKFAIEQQIKGNIGKVIDRIELATDNRICGGQLLAVDHFGITSLLFGNTIDRTDTSFEQLQEAIANAIRSLGQVSLLTFYPRVARLLAHFKVVPFINRLKSDFVLVHSYINSVIEQHRRTLDEHTVRDYIDSFLLECRQQKADDASQSGHGGKHTFTKQMLAGNVQGFLAAGIETVRTSLYWALLTLAAHQHVQQRVFLEIKSVCGNSTPNWANRAEMVYTQAVIFEIERWKTISPLNLMRMTTEDTTLDGFPIAKGVHVIANLWAVHFDPTYWRNPEQFDPERFIGIDKQLIKHQRFMPFSIGKRSCPGESLAQMELFLFVTCLVQKYTIVLAEENSFEEVLGLTLQPKHPVHLRFIKRTDH